MKPFIKNITTVMLVFILPGCGIFIKDCAKLSGDDEAYQQCLASRGNQQAQYELGLVAYEGKDYKTSLKWLKLAASQHSGRTAVYTPPVGGQKYGTVMMMDSGPATAGHAGAQSLLADIYDRGLGVKADREKAQNYRDMALRKYGLTP